MSKVSTLNEEHTVGGEYDGDVTLFREKQELIQYFRRRYMPEVASLGAASQEETGRLEQSLDQWEWSNGEPTREEVEGWRKFRDLTEEMLRSAQTLLAQLRNSLSSARSKGLISEKSMERWIARFSDPSAHFKQKEYFVIHQLPHYVVRWEEVMRERTEILKHSALKHLAEADVPDILIFLNEEKFLELPFGLRRGLNATVATALRAKEGGMNTFFKEVLQMLSTASSGADRTLHPGKVGLWLQRIFHGEYTEGERRSFVRGPFEKLRKEWMRVRLQFDVVSEEIQQKGVPRGFWLPTIDAFLSWHFDQRDTYIEEAKLRLRGQREEGEELTFLKVRIRHDLDTKDWEGAELLLTKAKKLTPDDLDLSSMERFLSAHRNDQELQKNVYPPPQEVLQEMRTIVHQLPTALQWIYTQALISGYATFSALTTLMYNRVWCHRHGHLTGEVEAEQAVSQENKARTHFYIDEGHTKKLERNIIAGDTAEKSAIRKECMSPQVLYTGSEGMSAVLARVREQKDNWGFRYWTTLVPLGVEYGMHAFIVEHINRPLKKGLRSLEQNGIPFSLIGEISEKISEQHP